MTPEETIELGSMCRKAKEGNLVVGSFAAELIGESYPLSMAMSQIVFNTYSDEELGRRFAEWCDRPTRSEALDDQAAGETG